MVLLEKLSVKKISARRMPRFLLEENKGNRVVDSEGILALFRRNPDEFLRLIHNCRRNMHRFLHFRDKGIVKTVSFSRRTSSEEGKDSDFGRQGDIHTFEMHAETSAPITWQKGKR